jgi:hypothetical protein
VLRRSKNVDCFRERMFSRCARLWKGATTCWLVITIVSAVIGFAGCSENRALDAIIAAAQDGASARYRSETTVTHASGKTTHFRFEQDTAERMHIVTETELIVLPDGVWQLKNGSWGRAPDSIRETFKQKFALDFELLRNAKNVTDTGVTEWQGQQARCYSYDIDQSINGRHLVTHSRFYIDPSGREVGTETDRDLDGEKTHLRRTFTYDESVRVKPPTQADTRS